MKYRKKPIIIDAYQTDVELDIETLEGVMHASIGDYIITGVNGEKYPCKPDIFEKTYELVEENNYKMNKELTPLQALEDIVLYLNATEPKGLWCKNIEIIKTALKRLETLENEQQSFDERTENKLKALEILKKLLEPRLIKRNKMYLHISCGNFKASYMLYSSEEYELLKEILK